MQPIPIPTAVRKKRAPRLLLQTNKINISKQKLNLENVEETLVGPILHSLLAFDYIYQSSQLTLKYAIFALPNPYKTMLMFAVLPPQAVHALSLSATRDVHLSGVWCVGVPEGELLQTAEHLRSSAAQRGLRRRHGHVPRGDQQLRDRDTRQARLPLGQCVPGQLWRGGS